ncbi:hypothetical protein JYT44_03645 [Caldithrix abyssi]|nr:hypothetical protein [Caldithrix abyssi]
MYRFIQLGIILLTLYHHTSLWGHTPGHTGYAISAVYTPRHQIVGMSAMNFPSHGFGFMGELKVSFTDPRNNPNNESYAMASLGITKQLGGGTAMYIARTVYWRDYVDEGPEPKMVHGDEMKYDFYFGFTGPIGSIEKEPSIMYQIGWNLFLDGGFTIGLGLRFNKLFRKD